MDANDELFFIEVTRSVRKDNTFNLLGKRFEAPAHLAQKKIQIRYNQGQPERFVVFFNDQRMGEATLLDFNANDRPSPRLRPTSRAPTQPPTQGE